MQEKYFWQFRVLVSLFVQQPRSKFFKNEPLPTPLGLEAWRHQGGETSNQGERRHPSHERSGLLRYGVLGYSKQHARVSKDISSTSMGYRSPESTPQWLRPETWLACHMYAMIWLTWYAPEEIFSSFFNNNIIPFLFFLHIYFPASGQAAVTGVIPSPPRFLPSIFVAHRVHQSHCSSIFHRVLLTHALALSASQFELKKKSQRICTSMHSAGLELTKLTYTRLEVNLIRHPGRPAATLWEPWAPFKSLNVEMLKCWNSNRFLGGKRLGIAEENYLQLWKGHAAVRTRYSSIINGTDTVSRVGTQTQRPKLWMPGAVCINRPSSIIHHHHHHHHHCC